MIKRLFLFIICAIVWLILTWNLNYQNLIVGAVVCLVVSLAFGETFSRIPGKWFQLKRYFWLICYLPLFAWECIKANLDVAYRVLHPGLPINPGIVKVKTNLKSGIGRTILANSITMTPGTLSVDIDGENLYIHWINVKTTDVEEASRLIVRRFEEVLSKIFE